MSAPFLYPLRHQKSHFSMQLSERDILPNKGSFDAKSQEPREKVQLYFDLYMTVQ